MYIIDGHNLIPKLPGISLSDPDDEFHLVQRLMTFCQKAGTHVVVFFDRAETSHRKCRSSGSVMVRFAPIGSTADQAIHAYLVEHRREMSTIIVVSSDRQVLADARSYHARVIPSEAFADLMLGVLQATNEQDSGSDPGLLTQQEVEEWERLFNRYNN